LLKPFDPLRYPEETKKPPFLPSRVYSFALSSEAKYGLTLRIVLDIRNSLWSIYAFAFVAFTAIAMASFSIFWAPSWVSKPSSSAKSIVDDPIKPSQPCLMSRSAASWAVAANMPWLRLSPSKANFKPASWGCYKINHFQISLFSLCFLTIIIIANGYHNVNHYFQKNELFYKFLPPGCKAIVTGNRGMPSGVISKYLTVP